MPGAAHRQPAAGYTQADVTNFAKMLTGWSIDLRADPPGFRFRPIAHEPGAQLVMGQDFPGRRGGRRGGTAFPRQPSRRRTASSPPSWCGILSPTIRRRMPSDAIEGVLRDTRGDLGAAPLR